MTTSITLFDNNRLDELIAIYRDGLLNDTLPFWINHCVDRESGGFMSCLDRDGAIFCEDKAIWPHGRFTWLLATLYHTVQPRPEWLELAKHGIAFLNQHGFDNDGRMFFTVTRDGRPLRKRRYLFSEAFAICALAAYARASHNPGYAQQAVDLFKLLIRYHTTPGLLQPKVNPQTRPMKGVVMPMIILAVCQELRHVAADPIVHDWINRSVNEIERDFMKPELQALLETVGPDGEFLDTIDGRMLNPGHAIEAAWFILHEARYRGGDRRLLEMGLTILDWMWQFGWDEEFGGILYFRDVKGKPGTEYWHDMKFWWPHNETIIATLLAYALTGDEKYARWHQMVHDWAYNHFPDPEYGEWFGYLHRDGRISTPLKGNFWKGPFHLPRMQWYCWQLLETIKRGETLPIRSGKV